MTRQMPTLYRIKVRNNVTGQTATVPDAPTSDVERLRRRLAELNEHNTNCEYWLEAVESASRPTTGSPGSWRGLALWAILFAASGGCWGCLVAGLRGAWIGLIAGAAVGAVLYCPFAVAAWTDARAAGDEDEGRRGEGRRAA